MCDLLQHSETSACGEGYWKGSGHVGLLVTYIANNISRVVKSLRTAQTVAEPDQESQEETPTKPIVNLPAIVISEAP